MIPNLFTQLTTTVPMKAISAAEVGKHLMNSWVFNNNLLEELIADNGGCFMSKLLQYVDRIMNIENIFTTTYYPQTNRNYPRHPMYVRIRPPSRSKLVYGRPDIRVQLSTTQVTVCSTLSARPVHYTWTRRNQTKFRRWQSHKVTTNSNGSTGFTTP